MLTRPDVLVLGAGGVLGEAWMMGVLAGIEDATGFDLRGCEYFVGTSAGAIVAAHLVAGPVAAPAVPSTVGAELEPRGADPRSDSLASGARRRPARRRVGARDGRHVRAARARAGRPRRRGAARGAAAAAPAPRRRRSTRCAPRSSAPARASTGGCAWSPSTAVRGRRVVFGSPGAPDGHRRRGGRGLVHACRGCSRRSQIGGREYVDGGVWSPTNLDAAPAGRDTHVLCLNPTGEPRRHATRCSRVVRNVARSAVSLEALALRRRGADVRTIAPNVESAAAMGTNFMDREPRGRVLAAGYRQGLAARGRRSTGRYGAG